MRNTRSLWSSFRIRPSKSWNSGRRPPPSWTPSVPEQFRRLGVTDAAQIITKLPGTTVVEGKFAVIRGLSDRYNITELNGAQILTADLYRVGVCPTSFRRQ